jgi:hypothetical protein
LGQAIQDTIRTGLTGETVVHGMGAGTSPGKPVPGYWWCGWISSAPEESHKIPGAFPLRLYMVLIYFNIVGDVKNKI